MRNKTALLAIPIITLVIISLFTISYVISSALSFPFSLGFPPIVRLIGLVVLAAGLSVMSWVFTKRGAAEVMISTYVTFVKMAKRAKLEEVSDREESLVIEGPYRYVRHPLYFGVVVMVVGWALLTSYSFIFVAIPVVFVFLTYVIARFEEKELRALFGAQYEAYSRDVPMMLPFTKLRKQTNR